VSLETGRCSLPQLSASSFYPYFLTNGLSGDVTSILDWLEKSIPEADAAVISLEMALYGGLINSRVSNDTLPSITGRLNVLSKLLASARIPVFITTVVMRIPSYDGDFEEPWCLIAAMFRHHP
jgi:hypothetical protein